MTKQIYVRGFKLPPTLCDLIEAGMWGRPNSDPVVLPAAFLGAASLSLSIPERDVPSPLATLGGADLMRANASFGAMLHTVDIQDARLAEYIGVVSSSEDEEAHESAAVLDLDYAVLIAVSDDFIGAFLDYRPGLGGPRVLMYDDDRRRWRTVAPNFDEFARAVGLVP